MTDITPLQKMEAMIDAGFHYPEPWPQYARCVAFIKNLTTCSCCWDGIGGVKGEIENFLKTIGESNEKTD